MTDETKRGDSGDGVWAAITDAVRAAKPLADVLRDANARDREGSGGEAKAKNSGAANVPGHNHTPAAVCRVTCPGWAAVQAAKIIETVRRSVGTVEDSATAPPVSDVPDRRITDHGWQETADGTCIACTHGITDHAYSAPNGRLAVTFLAVDPDMFTDRPDLRSVVADEMRRAERGARQARGQRDTEARAAAERAESALCECARPDKADDPHRHYRDDLCAAYADGGLTVHFMEGKRDAVLCGLAPGPAHPFVTWSDQIDVVDCDTCLAIRWSAEHPDEPVAVAEALDRIGFDPIGNAPPTGLVHDAAQHGPNACGGRDPKPGDTATQTLDEMTCPACLRYIARSLPSSADLTQAHHAGYSRGRDGLADEVRAAVHASSRSTVDGDPQVSCGGLDVTADGCFAADVAARVLAVLDGGANPPDLIPGVTVVPSDTFTRTGWEWCVEWPERGRVGTGVTEERETAVDDFKAWDEDTRVTGQIMRRPVGDWDVDPVPPEYHATVARMEREAAERVDLSDPAVTDALRDTSMAHLHGIGRGRVRDLFVDPEVSLRDETTTEREVRRIQAPDSGTTSRAIHCLDTGCAARFDPTAEHTGPACKGQPTGLTEWTPDRPARHGADGRDPRGDSTDVYGVKPVAGTGRRHPVMVGTTVVHTDRDYGCRWDGTHWRIVLNRDEILASGSEVCHRDHPLLNIGGLA